MATPFVRVLRVRKTLKNFKGLRDTLIPRATRDTLNKAAFRTMVRGREMADKNFELRNTWTIRSIQFEKTQSLTIGQQRTFAGSTMRYMKTQEFGGTRRTKGTTGVPIPTKVASGEGEGGGVRKKVVRKRWQRGNIKVLNTRRAGSFSRKRKAVKGKNVKQTLAIAFSMAERQGGRNRVVYLALGRKGLFWLRGRKGKLRASLLHDLSNPITRIPAKPWLTPATDLVTPFMRDWYFRALQFHSGLKGRR